jgi:zinc transport system substrate-binding protein
MRIALCLFIFLTLTSCGRKNSDSGTGIITVSIAPFKYFVDEIGGNDFTVNVMVPPGADPHVYEPFPGQIFQLRQSIGYISNGYLGFEMNWLDRFYETNSTMKRLSLGNNIELLVSHHQNKGGHIEGADPHYWESPKCALIIASSIRNFLCELNPAHKKKYEKNLGELISKIIGIDKIATDYFSGFRNSPFMIYHPNLAYLARDYGLEEIPVEFEGKEPPPSRMKELIDRARKDGLKTIFVQREYDTKNAKAIAGEIGAELKIIDPLSENWLKSITEIIELLHNSFVEKVK